MSLLEAPIYVGYPAYTQMLRDRRHSTTATTRCPRACIPLTCASSTRWQVEVKCSSCGACAGASGGLASIPMSNTLSQQLQQHTAVCLQIINPGSSDPFGEPQELPYERWNRQVTECHNPIMAKVCGSNRTLYSSSMECVTVGSRVEEIRPAHLYALFCSSAAHVKTVTCKQQRVLIS